MRSVIGLVGLVALLGLGVTRSLAGQEVGVAFQTWEPVTAELSGAFRSGAPDSSSPPRRDYRYEGIAFGEPDRFGNAIAVGLVGAAVGSGLGYVVGRRSSKPYPNQSLATDSTEIRISQDSMRRVAGYQHWKGAAIGSAAGAVLGALLGARARTACSDCDMDGGDVVKASLVTAGIGGAFGFLIGLASPRYEPR